jgi:hypothetical protein
MAAALVGDPIAVDRYGPAAAIAAKRATATTLIVPIEAVIS